jgi:hypothetical protein
MGKEMERIQGKIPINFWLLLLPSWVDEQNISLFAERSLALKCSKAIYNQTQQYVSMCEPTYC